MAQVKVIDQTDEMCGFVGDLVEIRSQGQILVYFDDIPVHLVYHESQLEYIEENQ